MEEVSKLHWMERKMDGDGDRGLERFLETKVLQEML